LPRPAKIKLIETSGHFWKIKICGSAGQVLIQIEGLLCPQKRPKSTGPTPLPPEALLRYKKSHLFSNGAAAIIATAVIAAVILIILDIVLLRRTVRYQQ